MRHDFYPRCGKQLPLLGSQIFLQEYGRCLPSADGCGSSSRRFRVSGGFSTSGVTRAREARMALRLAGARHQLLPSASGSGIAVDRRARGPQREGRPRTVPRQLGVDEKAIAKGQRYVTMVCDLEQGHVVEVAQDRTPGRPLRRPALHAAARRRDRGRQDQAACLELFARGIVKCTMKTCQCINTNLAALLILS
jgi:Transposase